MSREGSKCVIYVRVSTEMQVDGFSLDGQRNVLKKYAEREGMIIKKIYEDAGKSGKSIEGRPAFKEMMKDIEDGLDINYILVYKLSRFGRNAADILNSIELIQTYDINLIATEEGIDSSQTSGKLLISVLSAVSEIERENILEQTMNGRKEKARQGGWNGGFAPYGYKKVNKDFIIVPEAAEQVKFIYDTYINDGMSMQAIAREMNNRGMKRICEDENSNTRWYRTSVKSIIINPFYKGTIAFGRRTRVKVKGKRNKFVRVSTDNYISSTGKHQAIIDVETWNRAQEIVEERSKKSESTPYHRVYLLSGLLKCPCCGGNMVGISNKWTRKDGITRHRSFYKCINAIKEESLNKCTNKDRLNADEIENYVIDRIKEITTTGELAEKLKEQLEEEIDSSSLEKQLIDLQKHMQKLNASKDSIIFDIDNLDYTDKHFDRKRSDLNKRLDDAYDSIDSCEASIKKVQNKIKASKKKSESCSKIITIMSHFEMLLAEMTEEEKIETFKTFVKEIRFDDNNKIKEIIFNINDEKLESDANEEKKYEISIPATDNAPQLIPYLTYPDRVSKYDNIILSETKKRGRPKKIKEEITYLPRPKHYNREQPTYSDIKQYILDNFAIKVSTEYIAYAKRLYGISMQASRSKKSAKHNIPPKEKLEAIESALKYFNMI